MIANGITDDFHQQCPWVGDLVQTPECLERVERNILLQVFIVDRCAGASRRHVNQTANFRWIKIHVTVLLFARLYQA